MDRSATTNFNYNEIAYRGFSAINKAEALNEDGTTVAGFARQLFGGGTAVGERRYQYGYSGAPGYEDADEEEYTEPGVRPHINPKEAMESRLLYRRKVAFNKFLGVVAVVVIAVFIAAGMQAKQIAEISSALGSSSPAAAGNAGGILNESYALAGENKTLDNELKRMYTEEDIADIAEELGMTPGEPEYVGKFGSDGRYTAAEGN
ncbi:MAG: hypothetical protein LBQ91_01105 [Oscillospiraceae bacterium]|jgi:hypothetical protein|nr:hypothetical protein [Oscillospiraceae bacterium]